MPSIQYVQGQPFLIPDEVTEPTGTQPALPVTQDWYPAGYDNQPQAQLPAQPDMWATVARAGKRLLGVGGEERYQTWPERTIRSALTLPAEVMQGTVQSGPGLRREDVTDIPGTAQPLDPLIERAQDVAGLAGGTMFAGVKPGVASLGAGPVRRGNENLSYLLNPKSKIDVIGNEVGNIKPNGISVLKLKDAPEGYGANRLVYSENGKIIGAMQLTKLPNEDVYKVANTYVAPEFRRQGIATKLNDKAKELFGNIESSELEASPAGQAFRDSVLRSETLKVGAPLAALEKAPMFYSNVENAVKASKQNAASKEQWLSYLKNQPGVKPEELEWTVGNLPEGKITKQQLEQHIADNKVQFNEVWKDMSDKGLPNMKVIRREMGISEEQYLKMSEEQKVQLLRDYKEKIGFDNSAKYHSYQLPGGKNYRELLLTLPEKDLGVEAAGKQIYENFSRVGGGQTWEQLAPETRQMYIDRAKEQGIKATPENMFKSSHWDEPNVLAHVRMNDRNIPDVGKSLHIEEIQSDWHQAGRKQGYIKENPEGYKDWLKRTGNENNEQSLRKYTMESGMGSTIPNAPFKKTWDELALKRTINEAVRNGYDAISWTPGEAQAARYDLSKQVNAIDHIKNKNGTYDLLVKPKDGGQIEKLGLSENELENTVGKEIAQKIVKGEGKQSPASEMKMLSGLDLKVGGEGMKAFYDKMMVDKANALAKKYGAKVETKDLNINPKGWHIIPPDRNVYGGDTWLVKSNDYNSTGLKFWSKARAEVELEKLIAKEKKQPIHVLKLTPELKKAVSEKGFPLFTGGIPHVPPPEEPTFNERWRERVPDEMMKRDEIKDLLEQQKIRNLPLDYTPPERKFEGRPVHLTRVDYKPEF